MRVHVGAIKQHKGASLDLQFARTLPLPSKDVALEGPVQVDVKVTNTGRCYLVRGKLRARASFTCDRCLTKFSGEITGEIEDEFFPRDGAVRPDDDLESEDSEVGLSEADDENTFDGESFDLEESVAQHLLLAIPAKVVCREDCKGICPHCGQDLNEADCDCETDDVDPRLAALAKLLHDDE